MRREVRREVKEREMEREVRREVKEREVERKIVRVRIRMMMRVKRMRQLMMLREGDAFSIQLGY